MSGSHYVCRYKTAHFDELRCNRLLVADAPVRGGSSAEEKAAPAVCEDQGQPVLVQLPADCAWRSAAERLAETAAPGSLLVFDGRDVTATPPCTLSDAAGSVLVQRGGRCLFVAAGEIGHTDRVESLEKQVAALAQLVDKLEQRLDSPPKPPAPRRQSRASVKRATAEKKPE